jgi:hypothetical protein
VEYPLFIGESVGLLTKQSMEPYEAGTIGGFLTNIDTEKYYALTAYNVVTNHGKSEPGDMVAPAYEDYISHGTTKTTLPFLKGVREDIYYDNLSFTLDVALLSCESHNSEAYSSYVLD